MSSCRVEGDVAETDAWSDGVDISLDVWTKLSWLQNFQQIYSSSTKLRSSLVDDACGLEKSCALFTPNFTKRIQVLVSLKIWNSSSQRAWFQRNCLSHSPLAVNPSVRSLSKSSSRWSHSPCTPASALLGLLRPAPKPICKTFTCRDTMSAGGGCCALWF